MYTIILMAIIGAIIAVSHWVKEFGWDFGLALMVVLGIILGGLFGFIVAVVLPVNYETVEWQENIVSLKDNSTTSGRFYFLGSGIIEGRMRYVYYMQNADSTYQMWQCDYTDAVIKYSDRQPRAIITDTHRQNSLWNKFAIGIVDKSCQTYIFEVPKGAIISSYKLDGQ